MKLDTPNVRPVVGAVVAATFAVPNVKPVAGVVVAGVPNNDPV